LKQFPAITIPTLGKKYASKGVEEPYVSRRLYCLNSFIEGILRNRHLRSSDATKMFLCESIESFEGHRQIIDKKLAIDKIYV